VGRVPVQVDLAGEPAPEVQAVAVAGALAPARVEGPAAVTAVVQVAAPAAVRVEGPPVGRVDVVGPVSDAAAPISAGRVVGVATSKSSSRPS
jgi:hypothetical protein